YKLVEVPPSLPRPVESPWIPQTSKALGMEGHLGLEVLIGNHENLKAKGRSDRLSLWAHRDADVSWLGFYFSPCSLTQPSRDGKDHCRTCKAFQTEIWTSGLALGAQEPFWKC
ncbi:MAG: hypothetical protein ABI882_22790, partial [Acidobacteriota bacterium]